MLKLLEVLELDALGVVVGTAVAPPPVSVLSLLLELESEAEALVVRVTTLGNEVEVPPAVFFFLSPVKAKMPPTITATATTAPMMP